VTQIGVSCVYCGARHTQAAEVRSCWERSTQGSSFAAKPDRVGVHVAVSSAPLGPVLGRSVVVAPGQEPPAPWERCERASGGLRSSSKHGSNERRS
jgi:hypothetical protein